MRLFKAKGDKPEWRMIYDELLVEAPQGELIPYRDFDRVLGRKLESNRSPLYQARSHMGKTNKKWIEPVAGKGYRVIQASEHLSVAEKHKKRARRQLGLMVRVGESTDLTKLSPGELVQFDTQQRVNSMLFMVAVHHEKRITRIEQLLREEGRLLD